MKTIYLDHLFEKHILVAVREHAQNHPFEVVYSLAALFNIRITEGEKLAQEGMIPYVSEKLADSRSRRPLKTQLPASKRHNSRPGT